MNYKKQKLAWSIIKKEILETGTAILVSNAVDQAGKIDFEKLSQILDAFKEAKEDIQRDIDYWKNEVYNEAEVKPND